MEYFISRAEKIHGPTAQDEMRTWLAYGSLKPDDLVRRADEEEWFPARLFPEFSGILSPAEEAKRNRWLPQTKQWQPKTAARLRDFRHVTNHQRGGLVIWRLLSGFICRPITFWRAAATVFTNTVYRRAKDEEGYLRIWPRWVEAPVTVLVILHAVLWTGAIFWTVPHAKSLATTMVVQVQEAWHEATAEMPPPATVVK